MIKLKDLFQKPVDRRIEPVIHTGDLGDWELELEEYVLTNEITKHLESFFEAYNEPDRQNTGVWISGNFGCGKSHLLKMLSILLENRSTHGGSSAVDKFLPKCRDNSMLAGSVRKAAVDHPGQSILFNMGSMASEGGDQKQENSVLAIFTRVFNEKLGYFGKQPHIAQFEYELDRHGKLEAFKEAYLQISNGEPWEKGRESVLLRRTQVDEAYEEALGESRKNIIDDYRKSYQNSSADFAAKVADYIKRQGENFRLNFFVDEVGQYVASRAERMLTLQSIAEDLATVCDGRSWILITSQQSITDVAGHMGSAAHDEFSKIQGRFDVKLHLTSQDADEVIRRRLLEKRPESLPLLRQFYDQRSADFGASFDFIGGTTYVNYRAREDFIDNWPLVPYQFFLIRDILISLASSDAFQGRFSSTGERSMIRIFSKALGALTGDAADSMVPFNLIYDCLRSELNGDLQASIQTAERNLGDAFAKEVLKALFLVKYIDKTFVSTVHNMAILMIPCLGASIPDIQRQTGDALELLVAKHYARRSGERYEFLTDSERDLERQIQSLMPSTSELNKELGSAVYDDVLKLKGKIRYDYNTIAYNCAVKIDGQLRGHDYPLSINVVTPFNESVKSRGDAADLSRSPENKGTLIVFLDDDRRLFEDLVLYVRINRFNSQSGDRNSLGDDKYNILQSWTSKNKDRWNDVKSGIERLLCSCAFYWGGRQIEVSSTAAAERVIQAFQTVIKETYPNLALLPQGKIYTDKDLQECFSNQISTGIVTLTEAETEVLNAVRRDQQNAVTCTLDRLCEQFRKAPYGWADEATRYQVACLWSCAKAEIRSQGERVEGKALYDSLLNPAKRGGLTVLCQQEYDPRRIDVLRRFYRDLGGIDDPTQSARDVIACLRKKLNELSQNVALLLCKDSYEFLKSLEPLGHTLREMAARSDGWFAEKLTEEAIEKLLDARENYLDPISNFMNNQNNVADYNRARRFLSDPNLNGMPEEAHKELADLLNDPKLYSGGKIKQLNQAREELEKSVEKFLKERRAEAVQEVESFLKSLKAEPGFDKLDALRQAELTEKPELLIGQLNREKTVFRISELLSDFTERGYNQLISRLQTMKKAMEEAARQKEKEKRNYRVAQDGGDPNNEQNPPNSVIIPLPPPVGPVDVKVKRLADFIMDMNVGGSSIVDNESDLKRCLAELEQTLQKALRDGWTIRLK